MRDKKVFLNIILIYFLLVSCTRETNFASSISSITIINASPDNPNIVASFSDTIIPFYVNTAPISYGSFGEYGNPGGSVPLILVSSADTSQPLLQTKFNLKAGGAYSLFVSGQFKSVDTIFMKDVIPAYEDSVAGVRIINLSPSSQPISVNLEGNDPSQTEFAPLSYKQISVFKTYPINSIVSSYNFEIRDQASGNLLTTFSWSGTVYKNNTLVISGSEDPTSAYPIQVFQVNHY